MGIRKRVPHFMKTPYDIAKAPQDPKVWGPSARGLPELKVPSDCPQGIPSVMSRNPCYQPQALTVTDLVFKKWLFGDELLMLIRFSD